MQEPLQTQKTTLSPIFNNQADVSRIIESLTSQSSQPLPPKLITPHQQATPTELDSVFGRFQKIVSLTNTIYDSNDKTNNNLYQQMNMKIILERELESFEPVKSNKQN